MTDWKRIELFLFAIGVGGMLAFGLSIMVPATRPWTGWGIGVGLGALALGALSSRIRITVARWRGFRGRSG